ncbi:amidohydrolase [Cognatishimia sp. 1_MG-2023]|uniref:amidohydrolase n=1 Tax=Cognatishimia sp. 1_MG-2023 TaxID=3062642 RepID=UPI0026E2DE91|nr:amidohydrolase [Cognatishimia sp. 1_MG-2023]MDO6728212.1 amidohydrolase [Cognatishimia sp. 1_MG-2023]
MLTNSDIATLTELRRTLHKRPEVSGEEAETAKTIVNALTPLAPTKIMTGLGGHGVAAVFDSGEAGPTVLFRAELDALPIQEISDNPWKSEIDGKGHLCGHDGHMMFLMGLGHILSRAPVNKGRVILMFQPAEEDGSGARAVVADPAFADIRPDWAFAIHIEPGRPWSYVSTRSGLINCASQGLRIKLTGKTAHAADPEDGISPAQAVAELIPVLDALGNGGKLDNDFRLVTVTHVHVGEPTFGIAPGDGVIYATLRTAHDEAMEGIASDARMLATEAAAKHGLAVEFDVFDDFAASINDTEATDLATTAMNTLGIPNGDFGLPMRASEDFGVFGWGAKAAMLCMGPGEDYAALHNPDYDFPDDLIPVGVSIFEQITRDILGPAKT